MFSSAPQPLWQRLERTTAESLEPRLAPGVLMARGRVNGDPARGLLVNMISQRIFNLDERLKRFLEELEVEGSPALPELIREDPEWRLGAVEFLKNEGFFYLGASAAAEPKVVP